ncbi:MAG TPA: hypothetical protein VKE69_13195, partial [Planctomycetota bacterium]|nr:hypothetical protein [Planctomycetota bacterium]
YVDLFFATTILPLDLLSDAAGFAAAAAPIPNVPAIAGAHLYAQAISAWSSCSLPPFGLSASRGLAITLQ